MENSSEVKPAGVSGQTYNAAFGGVAAMPAASRPAMTTSRRSWYVALRSASHVWSPCKAAMAPICTGRKMPVSTLLFTRVRASTIVSLPTTIPTRQPAML